MKLTVSSNCFSFVGFEFALRLELPHFLFQMESVPLTRAWELSVYSLPLLLGKILDPWLQTWEPGQ